MGRPQKPLPAPPPLTPAKKSQGPTQGFPVHRRGSDGKTDQEFELPDQEEPSAYEVDEGEVIDESEVLFEPEEPMPDDENETGPAFGP